MSLRVDAEKCTVCGACVDTCPTDALSILNERIIVREEDCIDCGACEDECPVAAIRVS